MKCDVTVLMTAYNGMPYLPQAVDAVLRQTLSEFRFVIVNDGSTDNTAGYLANLADPRVVVIHQANRGTSMAANRGLEHCDTEFVARADADDIMLPTRLAEQRAFLIANPHFGMVGLQVAPLGDRGIGGSLCLPLDHAAIHRALLTGRHAMVHSTIMARTGLLKKLGGYWSLPAGEDYDLALRAAEISRLANLDRVLVLWRVHAASLNGSALRHVRFCLEYACELARRRQTGARLILPEEFQSLLDARPWWRRASETIDLHARGQYRIALAQLYGGKRLRGAARMTWAAICAPRLTIERVARVVRPRRDETAVGGACDADGAHDAFSPPPAERSLTGASA